MTTRETPLKVSAAPVIGVVLDAPSVLKASEDSSFPEQVAKRFRLVPNFFVSAPDAPEIVERLWGFAAAAYLDNPIPTLFKERLFVFLSRFCPIRYCIVRHTMGRQLVTRWLGCKPLSRWSSFCKHRHLGGGNSNRFIVAWRE
jgi:hypothetical protein